MGELLADIYKRTHPQASTVCVTPLIRFSHKQTDYLYLLYQSILEDSLTTYTIKDLSAFEHIKAPCMALLKPVIWHYHWLEFQDIKSLFGMPYKLICMALFALFGGKFVWTIHNLRPHDQRFLSLHAGIHRWMASRSEYLLVHCAEVIPEVSRFLRVSEQKLIVHPHPTYPATVLPRDTAIHELNTRYSWILNPEKPIALSLGNISTYKQLDVLAEWCVSQDGVQLIIAGPVKKGNRKLAHLLEHLSAGSPVFFVLPQFVEDDLIPFFYNAADISLFNFCAILTSGGVEMARSYKKSLVIPAMGCLTSLNNQPNVHIFDSKQELYHILNNIPDLL
ncbi:MAG: glycosyltransferase [Bacteroidota bacterium]